MTARALALEKQAQKLPATERERLAERLLVRDEARTADSRRRSVDRRGRETLWRVEAKGDKDRFCGQGAA